MSSKQGCQTNTGTLIHVCTLGGQEYLFLFKDVDAATFCDLHISAL